MMVERSSYTESNLMKDLDKAAAQLEAFGNKPQAAGSKQEQDLIKLLSHINTQLGASGWEPKKLEVEGMSAKIEKALLACQLFNTMRAREDRAGQRNVDQQIVSLSSSLKSALSTFDKNLRDLKKYKIGLRVEKTGESKHT